LLATYFVQSSIQSPTIIQVDCAILDLVNDIGPQYICQVPLNSDPKITEYLTKDVNFDINHEIESKTNDDVRGFQTIAVRFPYPKIHYFPRGLHKTFKNINTLEINRTGLKEVNREDIEPFPELLYVRFAGNQIEVLEEGLFASNKKLQQLYLYNNPIKFIHPSVLDNLNSLTSLSLQTTSCIDDYSYNDADKVKKIVNLAKDQCTKNTVFYDEYLAKKKSRV
jgi:Leucine rich repeat